MYLWQIRHIPICRQTFLSVTTRLGLVVLIVGLTGRMAQTAVGQGDEKKAPTSAPADKFQKATEAPSTAGQEAATEFVRDVHSHLKRHASVQADVEHTVSIGNQRFRATGRYLNSGSKLRLEYVVTPDQGADGSLLEVCDGKELWSLLTLGGTKRVTHRDVQQIKAAAAAASARSVSETVLAAELGLGGLTALFASLERTMIFDQMKQDEVEGRSRTVVQGRWKNDVVTRWKRKPSDPLPAYIPDSVRLFVNTKTLFPERIVYLKKQIEKDKKGNRVLVSYQFQNVEFDSTIDDREFAFDPPQDVVPEDITRQFLDRITKSQEGEAARGSSVAPATAKPQPAQGKAR